MIDIPYDMMNKGGGGVIFEVPPSLHRDGLDIFPGGIFRESSIDI